jgi:pilus assembly protein CpaE
MLSRFFVRGRVEEMRAFEHFSSSREAAAPSVESINDTADLKQVGVALAPIVVVLGAKGGAGSTTVAVNLAAALAMLPITVTIVDGNFLQPDVAQELGQDPQHTLMELMIKSSEIDDHLFSACRQQISGSNLGLISPPLNGASGIHSNLSHLANCLGQIRSYSQLWVIDVPKTLNKHLVTLTDMCDKIVLVFEANVKSVAACRRWIRTFRELGYESNRIICLLNRAGSKYRGVEEQLHDCFTDQLIFRLPNCYGSMFDSEARGLPIVFDKPRHPYTKDMVKLANHVRASCAQQLDDTRKLQDTLAGKR